MSKKKAKTNKQADRRPAPADQQHENDTGIRSSDVEDEGKVNPQVPPQPSRLLDLLGLSASNRFLANWALDASRIQQQAAAGLLASIPHFDPKTLRIPFAFQAADAGRTQLQLEKRELEAELEEQARRFEELQHDSTEKDRLLEEVSKKLAEWQQKDQLQHLYDRVGQQAQRLSPNDLRELFGSSAKSPCSAFVVSMDIRRSTDLMLKAKDPQKFSCFLTELWDRLRQEIQERLGVFDKFTGDGVLAFFPEFYSGEDAGLRAVETALSSHAIFDEHYKRHRRCFTSVIQDTGLGIGIDYGDVQMVQVGRELTVVGNPVVYACRMGGARPRQTLLNQPAYERVFDGYSPYCAFRETNIDFKNEGPMLAYEVSRNERPFEPKPPPWVAKTSDDQRQVPNAVDS